MLLSNLDASTSPYHPAPQDGLPWFAILNADHSPRPAWKAFRDMRAAGATLGDRGLAAAKRGGRRSGRGCRSSGVRTDRARLRHRGPGARVARYAEHHRTRV